MPKRKKREQHHLRQEPARRRNYAVGSTAPAEKYRVGFPMNLLANVKVFYVVGAVIMVGGVVVAAIASAGNPSDKSVPGLPSPVVSPTATVDPNATPGTSPTANPRVFTAAEQVIDVATKDYTATIKTARGDVVIKLYADRAPQTVNSFVFLAKKGYFDGLVFHRVVPSFVVQGGDPKGDGSGGPGYETKDEPNDIPNKRGTLSMAKRTGASQFGSQFFINLKDNPSLDFNNTGGDKFYPFGEVISGMDVVDRIAVKDVMTAVTIEEKAKPAGSLSPTAAASASPAATPGAGTTPAATATATP